MNPNDPKPTDIQDGVPLGAPEADDADDRVATGDRREDVHFEADPDQLVRMRATFKPDTPLPPEEHSAAQEREGPEDPPLVEDVRVAPAGPSVWDARPVDDDQATPKA